MIAEKYIELLRKMHGFDENVLYTILKKHNHSLDDDCINDLSKYYDYLDSNSNRDELFMLRLKEKYGYDNAYWVDQDVQWGKLSKEQ